MINLQKGGAELAGIPVLSLFSGPGGLDLGFEAAGFLPLLALDNDPVAVETYNYNQPNRQGPARVADLASIPPGQIVSWWEERAGKNGPRGIIGGPPCQAFSVSNVHRLEDDPRARLPLAYARILKVFHDRYGLDFFLFENVAGLAHRPHSASLTAFVEAFEQAGFKVHVFRRDAVRFGVPQYRDRMFIAGFNRDRYPGLVFRPPEGDPHTVRTVRETIGHLPEPVRFSRDADPVTFFHPNHWCMNPKSPKFTNGALQPGKMLGRSFRMLDWDAPSWTVAYGHREVHVHPAGHRRLSVYEAMLLQGFPPWYELRGSLSDQIRQVSDAVPPPLAKALAVAIAGALRSYGAGEVAYAQDAASGQAVQAGLLAVQT